MKLRKGRLKSENGTGKRIGHWATPIDSWKICVEWHRRRRLKLSIFDMFSQKKRTTISIKETQETQRQGDTGRQTDRQTYTHAHTAKENPSKEMFQENIQKMEEDQEVEEVELHWMAKNKRKFLKRIKESAVSFKFGNVGNSDTAASLRWLPMRILPRFFPLPCYIKRFFFF